MALGGAAWRNETRAWRRAMLKTPRPNTAQWRAVYYVAPILLEFLNKVWGKPNQLLQAVDTDIKNPVLLDGCQALGLLGKQVTGPWLRHTMVDRPVLQAEPVLRGCSE